MRVENREEARGGKVFRLPSMSDPFEGKREGRRTEKQESLQHNCKKV